MKRIVLIGFILSVTASFSFGNTSQVNVILRKVNSVLIEEHAKADLKMEIIKSTKTNEYYLTLWAKGRNFVSRTDKPTLQKGQTFLFANDNSWVYYPRIDKTIKTAKNQRLLGSDFSFVDMATLDLLKDYDSKIVESDKGYFKEALYQNEDLSNAIKKGVVIESIARKAADVVYPKVRVFINDEYQPVRLEFYTVSDQLIGILIYSQYKKVNGKIKPTLVIMHSSLRSDKYTKLYYLNAEYNIHIPDIYFTENYLKTISRGQ